MDNGASATVHHRANGGAAHHKLPNGNATTTDDIYDGTDVSDTDNAYEEEYYEDEDDMESIDDDAGDDNDSHKLLPFEEAAYDSNEKDKSR